MGTTRGESPVREEFCEWRTSDLSDSERFFAEFLPSEIDEISAAARGDALSGTLSTRLGTLRDEVIFGRGFGVIRRIPVDRCCNEDAGRALLGLGRRLGRPGRLQSSARGLPAERDGADLLGLLCLRDVPGGTTFTLSCAVAVHNGLARRRPDLLAALYRPNLSGEAAFALRGRALSARGLQGFDSLERLAADAEQAETYAHAVRLARASTVDVDIEPGDTLLVNPHHVVANLRPARTSYGVGWPAAGRGGELGVVAIAVPHLFAASENAERHEHDAERAAA